jgi:hypothetical protein
MPEATHTDQPWSYITSLLSGDTQPLPVSHTSRANSNLASAQRIKVAVLERPTRMSAVVSWCELAACCYWEQLSRRCRARKRGLLLDAMILASVSRCCRIVRGKHGGALKPESVSTKQERIGAPWKGAVTQWVRIPPGNFRSSR